MPFKSAKQRAYLYANEPEVAKNFAKKHGNKIQIYLKLEKILKIQKEWLMDVE